MHVDTVIIGRKLFWLKRKKWQSFNRNRIVPQSILALQVSEEGKLLALYLEQIAAIKFITYIKLLLLSWIKSLILESSSWSCEVGKDRAHWCLLLLPAALKICWETAWVSTLQLGSFKPNSNSSGNRCLVSWLIFTRRDQKVLTWAVNSENLRGQHHPAERAGEEASLVGLVVLQLLQLQPNGDVSFLHTAPHCFPAGSRDSPCVGFFFRLY